MIKERINLNPDDILNKEFKIDTRGYRLKEVDQFLDLIISDYQEYEKIIDDLEREKKQLSDEILNLKQEIRNLKTSVSTAKTVNENVSNVDVLKRLSQLEKIVYGKDE